jgi:ubiquinone/menaquinone biosynthesis C-methylase UbiE
MLMNAFDIAMQNSPLYLRYRKWWVEKAVTKFYRSFSRNLPGKRALEIGCGSGCGTMTIAKYFADVKLTATDLDIRLIVSARTRRPEVHAVLGVSDACRLSFIDQSCDAIFNFGASHHISDWRACLLELARVLKPGGWLFSLDSPIECFRSMLGRIARTYTLHPYDEMFGEEEFIAYLREIGFTIVLREVYAPTLYYFVIVAQKQ